MRRTRLTLAALALLALPLAAAQDRPATATLDLRFDAPAQAGPDVTAFDATWLLLVFGSEGSGKVALRFPQPTAERNVTVASFNRWGDTPPAESTRTLPGFGAEARFEGLASIYLEGERLRVDATGSRATLVRPQGDCLASLVEEEVRKAEEARYGAFCPPGGPVLRLGADGGDGTLPIRIEAEGLRVVELHHATLSCRGEPGCPGGGSRDEVAGPGPAALGVTGRVLGYSRLESADAAASGSGRVAHVLAGAPALDLAVQGWVRLPLADGGALARQTLRAEGNLTLAGLRLAPDGRMEASLSGDVRAARVDEGRVDPGVLLGVGAAGAAAVAAFAWLFSRIPPSRSLDHPRRRLLLEAIRANPGIHLRALARLAGGGPTLAQYHVAVLVRSGHVVERRRGRLVCLFENHGRYGEEWRALAALREPPLLRLHGHVAAAPGASRAEVVRAAEAWGWSRRTAYHRLRRLERLGLVQEDGAGAGLRALLPTERLAAQA